ncbi:hypothetical protein SNEBB_008358 [Seison nebaliae]|nr:hypothetical protein SNEBB_008358 [Seison nebaliae]
MGYIVCNNLQVRHGDQFPLENSPFEIIVNKNRILSGDRIRVTLIGDEDANLSPIMGFYMEAHIIDDFGRRSGLTGQWIEMSSNTMPLNCTSDSAQGWLHQEPLETYRLTATWICPDNMMNDIIFQASVVTSYHQFWENVQSETICNAQSRVCTNNVLPREFQSGSTDLKKFHSFYYTILINFFFLTKYFG